MSQLTSATNALALQMDTLALQKQEVALVKQERNQTNDNLVESMTALMEKLKSQNEVLQGSLAVMHSQLNQQKLTQDGEMDAISGHQATEEENVSRLENELKEAKEKNTTLTQELTAKIAQVARVRTRVYASGYEAAVAADNNLLPGDCELQ